MAKKIALLVVLIFTSVLLAFFLLGGAFTEDPASWQRCSTDVDCMLVREQCGSHPVGRSGIREYEWGRAHGRIRIEGHFWGCANPWKEVPRYYLPNEVSEAGWGSLSCQENFCTLTAN